MSGCATSPPDPAPSATEIEVRVTPYPYNADRYGEDLPVEIGRFDVPAVRGDSDSGLFELGFLRYPAAEGAQGAPYVVLTEEPAAEALSPQEISELRQSGDVIIFNRRGYGFSSPPPPCPGRINYPFEYPLEPELLSELTCAYAGACLEAMAENGLQPLIYSEKETKADLEALRKAIDADRIRTVGNRADPAPELAAELDALAAHLKEKPQNISVESRSGRSINLQVNDLDVAFLRFSSLVGFPRNQESLTHAARRAQQGDFAPLGQMVLQLRQRLGELDSIELLRLESSDFCKKPPAGGQEPAFSSREYAETWPLVWTTTTDHSD